METIIGREFEKEKLKQLLNTKESEFIAVYGRRRVGKTFLISEFFKDKGVYFEATGQFKAKLSDQLENFGKSFVNTFFKGMEIIPPESWKKAFDLLKSACEQQNSKQKIILFLDEVPWLATKRSGFISALEFFWNTWASRQKNIKLIVCGSASSWMIKKIVNSKGGLHNRITASIRLLPFSLLETKIYLSSRGINLDNRQILDIYMVMGGVPHYLKQIKKGLSATQNINEICFKKDGFLSTEFDKLYDSLFENSRDYKRVITALSKSHKGLLRKEILEVLGATPGGTLNRVIGNLEEAGFISPHQQYNKKKQGTRYRLHDEYSNFYLRWIKDLDQSIFNDSNINYWQTKAGTQSWKIWSGYTFETICIKHSSLIKRKLGISGVVTRESSWNHVTIESSRKGKGAQIDLLLDRNDNVISICEVKCHQGEFVINKSYAEELRNKINVFRDQTNTKKSIFLVMITLFGVKKNQYYNELVDNEVVLDDLFG